MLKLETGQGTSFDHVGLKKDLKLRLLHIDIYQQLKLFVLK